MPLQAFFFQKHLPANIFYFNFVTVLSFLVRKIFKLKLFFEKKISSAVANYFGHMRSSSNLEFVVPLSGLEKN